MSSLTINKVSVNNRPFGAQWEPSNIFILALVLSSILHFAVFRALPWLEVTKTKPPLTIVAELQEAPPSPPAQEVKQEEVKPEVIKTEEIKSSPKPQVAPMPILVNKQTNQATDDYTVPDIPKPVVMPIQPSPVAAAETQTKETATPIANSAPSSTVSSPSASSSTWSESDVWDSFGNDLQKLCERNKQYPAIAIRRGYQGSGEVLVRFTAEGKPNSITMEKSTGQKSLDDQAIEMVRKSLNELPLPAKFKGREFKLTIPVDFKLE